MTINNVDTSTLGSYVVTYNVSDNSGNAALSIPDGYCGTNLYTNDP